MPAAAFTVAGLAIEMVGVGLGAIEIRSTRRAALGFISRARFVSAAARCTMSLGGTVRLSSTGGEPDISDRVRALESRVDTLSKRVEALPEELEKQCREQIGMVMRCHQADQRDLETSIDQFAQELGAGKWRRYGTVVLLLAGAALQIAGVALAT